MPGEREIFGFGKRDIAKLCALDCSDQPVQDISVALYINRIVLIGFYCTNRIVLTGFYTQDCIFGFKTENKL